MIYYPAAFIFFVDGNYPHFVIRAKIVNIQIYLGFEQFAKRKYRRTADSRIMQDNTAEVLYESQEIIKAIRQFQAGTKKFWGACVDSTLPAFSVGKVKQGYLDAKKRGVQIMYITEITKKNLPPCMEIIKFAELRHLGGVRGNFAISDSEYVTGVKRGDSLTSLVRCNIIELVKQQRHVFDTLWKQAVPAKERIIRI
jgi:two-component system sensor histidine kinase VicK